MAKFIKILSFTLLSLFLFSFSGISIAQENISEQSSEQIFKSQIENDDDMELLVKENKRCIRCHQKKRLIKEIEAITSVGSHASEEFFNNCTACHGFKGNHPKDDTEIINFSEHSSLTIQTQNEQCTTCHAPEDLRSAEWTHDVHFTEINCSSCHELHQDVDPIKNIEPTSRILMCIDCHGI